MIGFARMGANMVRRLGWARHDCEADSADQVLSAMRHAFGGHEEKKS
jgi:6-phosphogluconate dehydrogenase (decarboxylating)